MAAIAPPFAPKTALLELLNGLFTRKIVSDLPYPLLPYSYRIQNDREPIMCNVAGDIEVPLGGRYRILGMRAVRDEQTSHDYDVLRVWGKDEGVLYQPIDSLPCSYRIQFSVILNGAIWAYSRLPIVISIPRISCKNVDCWSRCRTNIQIGGTVEEYCRRSTVLISDSVATSSKCSVWALSRDYLCT